MNNNRADRRRKGGSETALAENNKFKNAIIMMFGCLTWGMAVYWTFQETLSVGLSGIIGAAITIFLYKRDRGGAGIKLFILPVLIAAYFASKC